MNEDMPVLTDSNQAAVARMFIAFSVTRWGNLLNIGQLFKACGKIFLPKSSIFLGNFCKIAKIFYFASEIIFGQIFRHLATFYWSH